MIIIMGLPGAGKTTVISSFLEKNKDYVLLNYGSMMFDIAKQDYNVKKRDEIRKLSSIYQKEIQEKVSDKIKKLSKENEKLILDTHCAIKTNNGYLPGLPLNNLSKWTVSQLILISAPIDQINFRRKKDKTRIRDDETFQELKEHQDFNNRFLAVYSASIGVPCSIIINYENELEKTVKKLQEMVV